VLAPAPVAVNCSRAGTAARVREPGVTRTGSQTNVTRVLPSSPRDTPNQGRMSVLVRGAASTGFGSGGCLISSGIEARIRSSGDAAQNPARVPPFGPAFFERSAITWNLLSVSPADL